MKKDYLKLKHGYLKDDEQIEIFYLCAPSIFSNNSEQEADMEGVPPMGAAPPIPVFGSGHCVYNPLDWHGFTGRGLQIDYVQSVGDGEDDLPPITMEDGDTEPALEMSGLYDGGGKICCPKGHKGKEGWPSDHTEVSWVIMKVLNQFKDTQINIGSEMAREFLAKEIRKDLKNVGLLKED